MDIDPPCSTESESLLLLLSSIFDCYDKQYSFLPSYSNNGIHDNVSIRKDGKSELNLQSSVDDDCSSSKSLSSSSLDENATSSALSRNQNKGQCKKDIYPKRIRKSKYSDICGDLSHIRRDPKLVKRKGVLEKMDKKSRRKQKKMASSYDIKVSQIQDDKDIEHMKISQKVMEDRLLVQELMKFITNPKTNEHQYCALAVLSSDENLMQLFLDEKAKMDDNSTSPIHDHVY